MKQSLQEQKSRKSLLQQICDFPRKIQISIASLDAGMSAQIKPHTVTKL